MGGVKPLENCVFALLIMRAKIDRNPEPASKKKKKKKRKKKERSQKIVSLFSLANFARATIISLVVKVIIGHRPYGEIIRRRMTKISKVNYTAQLWINSKPNFPRINRNIKCAISNTLGRPRK